MKVKNIVIIAVFFLLLIATALSIQAIEIPESVTFDELFSNDLKLAITMISLSSIYMLACIYYLKS